MEKYVLDISSISKVGPDSPFWGTCFFHRPSGFTFAEVCTTTRQRWVLAPSKGRIVPLDPNTSASERIIPPIPLPKALGGKLHVVKKHAVGG